MVLITDSCQSYLCRCRVPHVHGVQIAQVIHDISYASGKRHSGDSAQCVDRANLTLRRGGSTVSDALIAGAIIVLTNHAACSPVELVQDILSSDRRTTWLPRLSHRRSVANCIQVSVTRTGISHRLISYT